jgi:hypothetical protein
VGTQQAELVEVMQQLPMKYVLGHYTRSSHQSTQHRRVSTDDQVSDRAGDSAIFGEG